MQILKLICLIIIVCMPIAIICISNIDIKSILLVIQLVAFIVYVFLVMKG